MLYAIKNAPQEDIEKNNLLINVRHIKDGEHLLKVLHSQDAADFFFNLH